MKTALRTIGVGLVALVVVLLGALTVAPSASATQQQTVTIVWQMPSWNDNTPTWPQQYVSHTANAGLDVAVPECGYFQVDVYRYDTDSDKAKVDALIAGGVLTAPNNPPEPLISGGLGTAWKFVNAGECDTTSPSPSPSESTPTPTPSETTAIPTPTPSESTGTPTPTPTTSTSTPAPSTSTPVPSSPSTLPKTGGSNASVTPLLAAGAGLVLLGTAMALLSRRKGTHA